MSERLAPLRQRLAFVVLAFLALALVGLGFALAFGDGGSVTRAHFWTWTQRHYAAVRWFTDAGLYPFYVLFAVVFAWGLYRRAPELRWLAQAYLLAQLLGGVAVVRILKMTLGRARPDASPLPGFESEWIGFTWDPKHHSFPSGHTADVVTSVVFAALLFRHPLAVVLALAWGVALALSRLALAKHYPSDALAGALIALAASWLTVRYWLLPRLERLPAVARPRWWRG